MFRPLVKPEQVAKWLEEIPMDSNYPKYVADLINNHWCCASEELHCKDACQRKSPNYTALLTLKVPEPDRVKVGDRIRYCCKYFVNRPYIV